MAEPRQLEGVAALRRGRRGRADLGPGGAHGRPPRARVLLSGPAMDVLREAGDMRVGYFFLPGGRASRPPSNMAKLQLLRRMGWGDLTAQGFRSTFRDWAAERTDTTREVAEAALAHTIADKVEAAYRRGDLFAKRRKLMDAWAQHCGAGGQR
jgi:integrase